MRPRDAVLAAAYARDELRRRHYSAAQSDDLMYRSAARAASRQANRLRRSVHCVNGGVNWVGTLGDDARSRVDLAGHYLCSVRGDWLRARAVPQPAALSASNRCGRGSLCTSGTFRIPMRRVGAGRARGGACLRPCRPTLTMPALLLVLTDRLFHLPAWRSRRVPQDRYRLPVDACCSSFAASRRDDLACATVRAAGIAATRRPRGISPRRRFYSGAKRGLVRIEDDSMRTTDPGFVGDLRCHPGDDARASIESSRGATARAGSDGGQHRRLRVCLTGCARTRSRSSPTSFRSRSRDGGPNFYSFDPNVVYEIHIDNNGDAVEDITYQWRFTTGGPQPRDASSTTPAR